MANGVETGSKTYGFWIVIAGLAVLVAVFFYAASRWTDVKDVTAAVGAVSGTVGTLVGAYFGMQAGAAGKDKAEADRDKAETARNKAQEQLTNLAALSSPDIAIQALGITT